MDPTLSPPGDEMATDFMEAVEVSVVLGV